MLDVTDLVLADHHTLRQRFAALDDPQDMGDAGQRKEALSVLWTDLANLLEIHAQCEEEVFYPQLLKKQTEDGEDEAEDAIDDHNKIRDAVREASRRTPGSTRPPPGRRRRSWPSSRPSRSRPRNWTASRSPRC